MAHSFNPMMVNPTNLNNIQNSKNKEETKSKEKNTLKDKINKKSKSSTTYQINIHSNNSRRNSLSYNHSFRSNV